jgi:AcrR family transcriptional regulator
VTEVTNVTAEVGSTIPAARERPPTKRGRATRGQLLAAAREVFSRVDFADARITEITRTAGVSTGSFYSYFTAKEDVFREVAYEVIDELTAAAGPAPDNPGRDPSRDIEHTLRAYVDVAVRHACLTRSIQQLSHVDPELREYRAARTAQNVARIEGHIRRLQESGLADAEVDAAMLAQVLQATVISAVYDNLVLYETGVDRDRLVEMLAHVWLRAIGLRSS